jgi:hypothetical protein
MCACGAAAACGCTGGVAVLTQHTAITREEHMVHVHVDEHALTKMYSCKHTYITHTWYCAISYEV